MSDHNRPRVKAENYVWNVSTLDWEPETQSSSSSSSTPVETTERQFTVAMEFDVANNPIYIGRAALGSAKSAAAWQIRKLTFDTENNPTDIQLSNGSRDFNTVWDDRASLSYS